MASFDQHKDKNNAKPILLIFLALVGIFAAYFFY
jgi:hypothetical protein